MAEQIDYRSLVKGSGDEDYDPDDVVDMDDGLEWDEDDEQPPVEAAEEAESEAEGDEEDTGPQDWEAVARRLQKEKDEKQEEDSRAAAIQKEADFKKYLESIEDPTERVKAELDHERDLRRAAEYRSALDSASADLPAAVAMYSIFTKHFDIQVEDTAAFRAALKDINAEVEGIISQFVSALTEDEKQHTRQRWGTDTNIGRTKQKPPKAPESAAVQQVDKDIADVKEALKTGRDRQKNIETLLRLQRKKAELARG